MKATTRRDVHQEITDSILKVLERGAMPWRKDWRGSTAAAMTIPRNLATQKPYRGVNVLLLWSAAQEHGYETNLWATYRQAASLGGHVRKGEQGTMVVFYKSVSRRRDEDDPLDKDDDQHRPFWLVRHYWLFNVQQCEGIPIPEQAPVTEPRPVVEGVEQFIKACGADVRYGGDRAFYRPQPDYIQLPPPEAFNSTESFYATLLHEHIHWSGHPARLNRNFGERFGDQAYAFEELVAELGAAFMCGELKIRSDLENHASYLSYWVKLLIEDKRAIFSASSHATRAADYLRGLQGSPDDRSDDATEVDAGDQ